MIRLFDTHAHLMSECFDADREAVISGLPERGIELVVDVGCNEDEIKRCVANAEKYAFIYCAIGYHPHEAANMRPEHLDMLKSFAANPKVRAIGEIGLDYHYEIAPRDVQKEVFASQLDLAQEVKLPVVLHIREATGDALDILRKRKGKTSGVAHCFSGSYETARELIDMGFYISFAGPLTFDNASRLRDIASLLPIDSILVETDCPYLAPHPMRGRRNDPGYVLYTLQKLADIRGLKLEEAAAVTLENGRRIFDIRGEERV